MRVVQMLVLVQGTLKSTGRGRASSTSRSSSVRTHQHLLGQLHAAVRVAPLVVVPGDDLHDRPSSTEVSGESKIDEYGDLTMSEETIGSSVLQDAGEAPVSAWRAERVVDLVRARLARDVTVRSTTEPVGTGARTAKPCSLPCSSGITRPIAFAAPVDAGTRLTAAARARRKVLVRRVLQALVGRVGVDRGHQAALDADRVVQHLGDRARQFVVHDALEITWWLSAS